MKQEIDFAEKLEQTLPPQMVEFLKQSGERAARRNEQAYIVGGVVRDMLLGIDNFDIDLTIEGDAVTLARELLENEPGKITVHKQFNTATIEFDDWSVDFATARSETYDHPGALPKITPASLEEDLKRRDFTVNALAIGLSGKNYGKLYDPCNGKSDLQARKIRILHDGSFIDDSTRIWRGLRYEQRLGFRLEPHTLELLKRDIPMLDTVSGERLSYEIECILKEKRSEQVFSRAYRLGVFGSLNPFIEFDSRKEEWFARARKMSYPNTSPDLLYWMLLTFELDIANREKLISRLRLPKQIAQSLRDCHAIKERLEMLAAPEMTGSEIYRLLHGYSPSAIIANIIAAGKDESRAALKLYIEKLKNVKSTINGNDLLNMGIEQGPQLKRILDAVLDARLNGEALTREEEIDVIRKLQAE